MPNKRHYSHEDGLSIVTSVEQLIYNVFNG